MTRNTQSIRQSVSIKKQKHKYRRYKMSYVKMIIILEQFYEEALSETLKQYKDVGVAEEEAEKIAIERLEGVNNAR